MYILARHTLRLTFSHTVGTVSVVFISQEVRQNRLISLVDLSRRIFSFGSHFSFNFYLTLYLHLTLLHVTLLQLGFCGCTRIRLRIHNTALYLYMYCLACSRDHTQYLGGPAGAKEVNLLFTCDQNECLYLSMRSAGDMIMNIFDTYVYVRPAPGRPRSI